MDQRIIDNYNLIATNMWLDDHFARGITTYNVPETGLYMWQDEYNRIHVRYQYKVQDKKMGHLSVWDAEGLLLFNLESLIKYIQYG